MDQRVRNLTVLWRSVFHGDEYAQDRCPECGASVTPVEMGGALTVSCSACGDRNVWTFDSLAAAGAIAKHNREELERRRALGRSNA